jgi:HAD superfamily hydrolase (TIGR01549 family)
MGDGRFIDRFEVLLLDMGNTFMFGCDDFGADADFHATYRRLGGSRLDPDEVASPIRSVFAQMLEDGSNPEHYERFGSVSSYLARSPDVARLPASERDLLEQVFALHELGRVSERHADALRRLRRSHPLGVVSNVWSRPDVFEAELRRAGIMDLFGIVVWSSAHGCVKPSARLFQRALRHFGAAPHRVVYIGDHPRRDVAGAKALGMAAVWIANRARPLSAEDPQPDLIVGDLVELLA